MQRVHAYVTAVLLAFVFALTTVGCSEHRYGTVYDPYYHDNHRWTAAEDGYYRQWEVENHREHVDWARRNAEEQKQYWNWRHEHHDHDHDHDKH